jgi:hypothetical protein
MDAYAYKKIVAISSISSMIGLQRSGVELHRFQLPGAAEF